MSVLFNPKEGNFKKVKLNKFSYKTWRLVYLLRLNSVYQGMDKKIYNRSSRIPSIFKGYDFKTYNGRVWGRRYVTRWIVGHRFGEFTWNRKYALFKVKKKKK